ncbi:beta-ketoacyl synthase N-terminal-like domain-containing protein, partial [Actinoallomurus acaciae]
MTDEPIAVVGVGCRFPGGANDLRSLGELLAAGRTCIAAVPADRWGPELHDPARGRPGTVANHRGAFLQDVDRFDSGYFGIPPREAEFLDPQHRMLMEVAWEAMSDSGRPRDAWRGSRTAVYVGTLANDYQLIHARTLGIAGIGPHYASGVEPSFAAGRVSYAFDLRGPASTVNSACSSSLLAVHLACQALRAGECATAVAGGVSLLLGPDYSVFMSSIGAVSRTGRCRPFDAAADGLVRGEGCGFVTLKRLCDAVAEGDRVYAVIRGSAVAHDGASIGITAPNALAQEELLLTALERAGVAPADVDYVEAHGTGTPLGDQTELDTLGTVYGAHRRSPVPVGSIKAVFGHTDAAAGVAGLLKAICVIRSGDVPPQPGFSSPTPGVDWRGVTVSAEGTSLRADGRALRAGVSSFGASGTLVHAVVEAPEPDRAPAPVEGPHVLLVSSAREEKLGEQAARMRGLVDEAGDRLGELVASAATRSTVEAFRLAVVADGPAGLTAALTDPANPADGAYTGAVLDPGAVPPPAFVYAGQGGQWPGMALDLYDRDADVRNALDECHALIGAEASWSLLDELRSSRDDRRLERTDRLQPAIFAVQVAITRWLAARGITPHAVVGHSLGEVAAAHAAGCLSLAQAVRVVVRRAEVLHETHGTGRMYAVQDAPDVVDAVLREIGTPVIVSGLNGPRSTVIAGPPQEAADAARVLEERGLRCRRVPIDVATHSPVVAHCGPLLEAALQGLDPAPASVRFASSVDLDGDTHTPDAAYWARNITDPVRLWPAVDRLLTGRGHLLIEIGPHPVLVPPLTDALRGRGRDGTAIATLRRDQPGATALHRAVAQLHVAGVTVDWPKVTGRPSRHHTLPAPSWGGGRYWLPGVGRGSHEPGEPVVSTSPAVQEQSRDEPDRGLVPAVREAAGRTGADMAGRIEAAVRDVLALPGDFRMVRGRGLFEQGLDSLTAVSLRRRLQEEFAVELDASVIFEHPTITALAEFLAEAAHAETASGEPDDEPRALAEEPARPSEDDDAIAVIGIGCRLPGAPSPDAFWTLLTEGRDALGDLPPDRRREDPVWTDLAEDVPVRHCYLDDITGFDAEFFRIAPREARSVDPQQRMLLEVAWDALEDAGCRPRSLHGRQVGVYVGLEAADYQHLLASDLETIDLYYGTGTSFAASAGRLSYFLGLNGPGVVVDTACSSALTAVHLACQGLRADECDVAVVGGAHAIVAPTMMAAMAGSGALAADGRCKTFDDAADGYGYGEGAVVLVLKRLAAARRDDDRVYAVIRASAVNQDGASGGFTVPSASAQTALCETALKGAGWSPADVDYVETHGTGTPLGDPIEVGALARAYGPGRDGDRPLLIGSAKPNVGHLSAASGLVGLLKVVLAMHRREIPRHVVDRPSARIDWSRLPVALVTGNRPWPDSGSPSRAGVSSFGFTGSNAHVLVEQAAAPPPREEEPGEPFVVLPVTANSAPALRAAAGRLAERLGSAPEELAEIAGTATFHRSFLGHRLAVVGGTPADLVRALEQVAAGDDPPASARSGHVEDEDRRDVTFWYGTELPPEASRARFGASPAYRRGLAACAEHLARMTGQTPDLLAAPPAYLRLAYRFAHHVAITQLWRAYGVRPDGVAGEPATVAWAEGRIGA